MRAMIRSCARLGAFGALLSFAMSGVLMRAQAPPAAPASGAGRAGGPGAIAAPSYREMRRLPRQRPGGWTRRQPVRSENARTSGRRSPRAHYQSRIADRWDARVR